MNRNNNFTMLVQDILIRKGNQYFFIRNFSE